ncbi:tail completion protein gp17 [Sphingomonas baiyangensis]|uniref:DUF3168 domain-containing protein n=1 Tax=Sphingomonas baiyangensis TaxID=2572576 RepID=A0A4V5PTW5_9SPHN|nr:DUF3168 domain-containing protein [Sphingomonas baiyangensis]TKD51658.1 DUF3168 domain-containing protein [Sphingomonas baiyangensis]
MTALLHAALAAAVRGHAPLGDALTATFEAPPVRAARPYALIAEAIVTDWGAKDIAGCEARCAIELHDGGESPARLRALIDEMAPALAAMPATIGGGWRIVTLVPLRRRIVRARGDGWIAVAEFRVRMLRSN